MQWNLFKPISQRNRKDCNEDVNNLSAPSFSNNGASSAEQRAFTLPPAKMYHVWRDIEENYQKLHQGDEVTIKPRFYTLTPVDTNSQDTPKLDGLVSFFLFFYYFF